MSLEREQHINVLFDNCLNVTILGNPLMGESHSEYWAAV